jgi:hypothetical protein
MAFPGEEESVPEDAATVEEAPAEEGSATTAEASSAGQPAAAEPPLETEAADEEPWVEEQPPEVATPAEPESDTGGTAGPSRRDRIESWIEEHVDQEVWATTRLRFDVQPAGVAIAVRGRGDSRFRPLGRAADWSGRVYELPGPGDYLLLFRGGGDEEIVLVRAGPGSSATDVSVRLAAPAAPVMRRIDRPDLTRYPTGGAVVLDFTPRRLAARARVIVDGSPVGQVQDFAGGRTPLRLAEGDHLVAIVGPGLDRIELIVEVRPEYGDAVRRIEMEIRDNP